MRPEDVHIRYVLSVVDRASKAAIRADNAIRQSAQRLAAQTRRLNQQQAAGAQQTASQVTRAQSRAQAAYGATNQVIRMSTQTMRQNTVQVGRAGSAYSVATRRLQGFNTRFQAFRNLLLALRWPAVITGLSLFASGLTTAATAAAGLTAALVPLTGVLAALPAMFVAFQQGSQTMKLGFSGVGDALKALEAQTVKTATTGARAAEQQEQSAERVRNAENRVRDAQEAVAESQERLTDARREARRELVDMALATENAGNAERRAQFALREAYQALQETNSDPNASAAERDEARLNYDDAIVAAKGARVERGRAQRDLREVQRAGVEGSDQVVSAQRALRDAIEGQREAAHDLKVAMREAAEGMGVADAAANKVAETMAQLSPAAQSFVKYIFSLRPALEQLQDAASERMFPGLEAGLRAGMAAFPEVQTIVGNTAQVFGDFGQSIGELVGSAGFRRDLAAVGATNVTVMENLSAGAVGAAEGFQHLIVGSQPLITWMSEVGKSWGESFGSWMEDARNSGDLDKFFDRTKRSMQAVGDVLDPLGDGLAEVFDQAYQPGMRLLRTMGDVAQEFEDWTDNVENQAKIQEYFEQANPAIEEMGRIVLRVGKMFLRLGKNESLEPLLKAVRLDLIPALEDLLATAAGPFGQAMIRLFSDLLGLFTAMQPVMAPIFDVLSKIFDGLSWAIETVPGVKALLTAFIGMRVALKLIDVGKSLFGLNDLDKRSSSIKGTWEKIKGLWRGGGPPTGPGGLPTGGTPVYGAGKGGAAGGFTPPSAPGAPAAGGGVTPVATGTYGPGGRRRGPGGRMLRTRFGAPAYQDFGMTPVAIQRQTIRGGLRNLGGAAWGRVPGVAMVRRWRAPREVMPEQMARPGFFARMRRRGRGGAGGFVGGPEMIGMPVARPSRWARFRAAAADERGSFTPGAFMPRRGGRNIAGIAGGAARGGAGLLGRGLLGGAGLAMGLAGGPLGIIITLAPLIIRHRAAIVAAIKGVVAAVKRRWEDIAPTLKKPFVAAWDWIKRAWGDTRDWIGTAASDVVSALRSGVSDTFRVLTTPHRKAWAWIKDAFGDARSWIRRAADRVGDALSSVWRGMSDRIITPIRSGINKAVDFMRDAPGRFVDGARRIGTTIIDAIKGAFKGGGELGLDLLRWLTRQIDGGLERLPGIGANTLTNFVRDRIPGFQGGGFVVPGDPTRDGTLIMAAGNEVVLTGDGQRRLEAQAPGLLSQVVTSQLPHFRNGGRLNREQQVISQAAHSGRGGRRRIPGRDDGAATLWGLYGQESNYGSNPGRSSAGAQGPFQFMPATARAYGINPQNFVQSAYAAAKYLATYAGRGMEGMLAAYNAGPGRTRAQWMSYPETRNYVREVPQKARTWPRYSNRSGRGATDRTATRDRGGRGRRDTSTGPTHDKYGIQIGTGITKEERKVLLRASRNARLQGIAGQQESFDLGFGFATEPRRRMETPAERSRAWLNMVRAYVSEQFNSAYREAVPSRTPRTARQRVTGSTRSPSRRGAGRRAGRAAKGSFERLVQTANRINNAGYAYRWGGGHGVAPIRPTHGVPGGPHRGPKPGYDCSGAIGRLLQESGIPGAPSMALHSSGYGNWGVRGPGRRFTIHSTNGHVWATIGNKGWGTSASNPRGGAGWHSRRSGGVTSHPRGFRRGGRVGRKMYRDYREVPTAERNLPLGWGLFNGMLPGLRRGGFVNARRGYGGDLTPGLTPTGRNPDPNYRAPAPNPGRWRGMEAILRIESRAVQRAEAFMLRLGEALEEASLGLLAKRRTQIINRIRRFSRGGITDRERGQIKLLQGALDTVDMAVGAYFGRISQRVVNTQERLARQTARQGREMREANLDPQSSAGIAQTQELAKTQQQTLQKNAARLRSAIRRAQQRGFGPLVLQLQEQLDALNEDIAENATVAIEQQRAFIRTQAAEVTEQAAGVTASRQIAQQRLELEQQMSRTFDTAGGRMQRADFIRNQIVPGLQNEQNALLGEVEALRRTQASQAEIDAKQREADAKGNEILQAQLDAQNLIEDNTRAAAESLRNFTGTLAFGYGGQQFTDLSGIGVGA